MLGSSLLELGWEGCGSGTFGRWLGLDGVQSGLGGFLRRVYPELAHMICLLCDTLYPVTMQQEGTLEAARCQHQNLGIPSNQNCEANKIFIPSIVPSVSGIMPQQQ